MRIYRLLIVLLLTTPLFSSAQFKSNLSATAWVDSVFNSLTPEQRIAQLMVIRAHSNFGADHVAKVMNDIKQYNVGALCFFQGGPVRQANLTNYYQANAQTPIMVTIDGEYGLGMRLDSAIKFPYQLTLGAMNDTNLVYELGKAVGEQCKRIGVHVNYAPVVDINNNPNNPVIGFRSFGENKYKVTSMGIAYMRGMQDAGIMACAKHFPGHGDVDVDSHYDLPVIKKVRSQLDSMELYPFRAIANAGVGSMMIAHLYIPAIDNTANRATSLSKKSVTGILREDLGYDGLTFTDALEMKGVAKFFPGGTISVEALIAGNDMLCLPESVAQSITAIKKAITDGKLTWEDINAKCKKVLVEKYKLGLHNMQPISTTNLVEDINASTNNIRKAVAEKSLTVLKYAVKDNFRNDFFSFPLKKEKKIAYVAIGNNANTALAERLKTDLNADVFFFSYKDEVTKGGTIVKAINNGKYDAVVVGIHDVRPGRSNNYGISKNAIKFWQQLNNSRTITMLFGNVLSAANFCNAKTLIACNEDDAVFQNTAADWLQGKFTAEGKLPVRVCNYKEGHGIHLPPSGDVALFPIGDERFAAIDSIANDAIAKRAFPGCVVLAAKDGQIAYHKAFGKYQYETEQPVQLESIFDLASVTKISATTVAVMKLYEQKKIDLKKNLSDYLPWVKKTDKANIKIQDLLLHQGGLISFIQFYKETMDANGKPATAIYAALPSENYTQRVAENMYIRNDWRDTLRSRILKSKLGAKNKYVYSDNDFIFLGNIVEEITGKTLDEYVRDSFYIPMNMVTTGYKPLDRFTKADIVPTENDTFFRQQLLWGDVHDEGASMFGNIAGHAGLFSNAYDLGKLYQMLLNGGELNGHRFLKLETIREFTAYKSAISRRGLGFDKPEKDNAKRKDPYPAKNVSSQTYGHTGYTGTCVWVDPRYNIVYIFLSNRVYPTRDNSQLFRLNVRGKIQDELYKILLQPVPKKYLAQAVDTELL